ncbi:MAG TPA: iron-sulfur cluster co-chaperone HscB C-terminal domain-containing protein, partial [Planctomycetota bacterium]|nr:iron-sulfur cluster co-chaperone HscB C-terminal domain-containing protein [Planctomycetota bacterium]
NRSASDPVFTDVKVCPSCKASLETPLACSACGALVSGASVEGPFEIFGLPRAYALDKSDLRRRLLRFSRLVHPDFFATAGETQRAEAERASAALNVAHETLADDASRADWIVRDLGGPDELAERAMPQEFLMEVLDWNETLDAARSAQPGAPERAAIQRLASELEARRGALFEDVARRLTPLPASTDAAALRETRKLLNAARYVEKTLSEIAALRVEQSLSR